MDKIIKQEYNLTHPGNGIGYHPVGPPNHNPEPFYIEPLHENRRSNHVNPAGYLASTGNDPELLNTLIEQSEEFGFDPEFEFRQGWKYVNGVHRAFYLEAISEYNNSMLLDTSAASYLPLALKKEVMGRVYTVYLDNMVFTPNSAKLDAYIIISTPPSSDKLVFEATNVGFGADGIDESKMSLGTDVAVTLNNATRLIIKGNEKTFVSWDCKGFKGIGIEADVEFCRKYLTPLTPGTLTPKPDPETVKAHFITEMPAWGEFIVQMSIDPFAITGHEDIKWQIQNVTFDFSSSKTPENLVFPPNYTSPFVINNGGTVIPSPQWKGFYLSEVTVTLPTKFANQSGQTVTVGAEDVIIDDTGFTGRAFAAGALPLSQGNLDGWAFSIDTFSISVTSNRFTGVGIAGLVNIPLFNKNGTPGPEDCVKYNATVLPGNIYSFSLSHLASYKVNMWKATAEIFNDSEITLTYVNGNFLATAVLNGKITIDSSFSSSIKIKVPEIGFEGLTISNKDPYFHPGCWDKPAAIGANIAGFGLKVSNVNLVKHNNQSNKAALKFNIKINLAGDSLLAADGAFGIVGSMVTENGRQRWKFDDFEIDKISINASFPGVKRLAGELEFFGKDTPHQIYGTGFHGAVAVEFQGIDVSISAVGQFGRKQPQSGDEFKYFFVDALVQFSPAIGGPLQIKGFGGGVFYHMDRVGGAANGLPPLITAVDPLSLPLGQSLSSIQYVPNKSISIGIKATVVLCIAKENAFNANASFEIFFNAPPNGGNGIGGIAKIAFNGNARFMAPMDFGAAPVFAQSGSPNIDAAVKAYIDITYNFNAKELHGIFQVNINVGNTLVGNGACELLFRPGKWFVNIGTPAAPITTSLNIPGIGSIASVKSYFNIGKDIPDMPPLPPNVQSLTGLGNFMANESMRKSGNGFAFGSRLQIGTGDLEFLMFYANFTMGAGFDLMLQDYGEAVCAQTNEPIGINGWYASGQMYAFVQGKIGIKVSLWGSQKHFDIIDLSAAAALQAKLPNPFWAQGAVGGRYRILGGLVKGDCNFKFTLGESCQLTGGNDPNADFPIILDVLPADSSENMSTLTMPMVTFNLPVNTTWQASDGNSQVTYKVELPEAKLIYNGLIQATDKIWNESSTVLSVQPKNFLPAGKWVKFRVRAILKKNNVQVKEELKEVWFKTGPLQKQIPDMNVVASYPMKGQFNYYKNEWNQNKGYILLKYGQNELLRQRPGYQREVYIATTTQNALPVANFTYDSTTLKIEFPMPVGQLVNGKVYKLLVVQRPVNGTVSFGGPAATTAPAQSMSVGDGPASSTPPPTGPDIPPTEYLFTIYFRVSQYNTFAAKIDDLKTKITFMPNSNPNEPYIRAKTNLPEPFDAFEMKGTQGQTPLVSLYTQMDESQWWNKYVNTPYQLRHYDVFKRAFNYDDDINPQYVSSFDEVWNPEAQIDFGEASTLWQASTTPLITAKSNYFPNGPAASVLTTEQRLLFDFASVIGNKFIGMKQDLAIFYYSHYNPMNYPNGVPSFDDLFDKECEFIFHEPFPLIQAGDKFPVLFSYTLPGTGILTTQMKKVELVKQ